MGNTDRNQCAWRRGHGAPYGADPCLDTQESSGRASPEEAGPGPFPIAWAELGGGGFPILPICPLLSGRPGQSARRRRRKCFLSSIGKNNSGARADREEGAPALRSLRPASSVSASPAGSDPDTPPAPRTALVTGTESSGTAQHPSLGPLQLLHGALPVSLPLEPNLTGGFSQLHFTDGNTEDQGGASLCPRRRGSAASEPRSRPP